MDWGPFANLLFDDTVKRTTNNTDAHQDIKNRCRELLEKQMGDYCVASGYRIAERCDADGSMPIEVTDSLIAEIYYEETFTLEQLTMYEIPSGKCILQYLYFYEEGTDSSFFLTEDITSTIDGLGVDEYQNILLRKMVFRERQKMYKRRHAQKPIIYYMVEEADDGEEVIKNKDIDKLCRLEGFNIFITEATYEPDKYQNNNPVHCYWMYLDEFRKLYEK